MSKVEVLVATMHQKDLSKYKEMNIQTDAVFANQDDRYEYYEEKIDGNTVKMITTAQRGVGKNRNTALLHASSKIYMFADDDMVYSDGYEQEVIAAFDELKDADIIIFNCDSNSDRKPIVKNKISRVKVWNFTAYGTYRIVVKRKSIMKANITFTLLFGGGAKYSSGEDSLFLRESLKKGLKIYAHPYKIANVKHETSTWFEGLNAKYMFNKGAWLSAAFPFLKYIGSVYFVFRIKKRFKNNVNLSFVEILKLMLNGMKGFKNNISYDQWKSNQDFE